MTDQELPVNHNENIFIQRCPHDEENPYTMIRNDLIRDMSISPDCRWLIIYLLSNKAGWKIRIQQVINHVKQHMGKNQVYKLFEEAINAGYIKREDRIVKNPKGGSLKSGVMYFVSETPKFKKCYRRSNDREAGDRDAENGEHKNKHPEEGTSQEGINTPIAPSSEATSVASANAEVGVSSSSEKSKKIKASPVFSSQVHEVTQCMIKILAEKNQGYRPAKDLTVFLSDVRYLLEEDKQKPEYILEAFDWAVSDTEERGGFKGWSGVIATNKAGRKATSPAGRLREHLGKIDPQMKARPKRTFAPSSNDARGLANMHEWAKGAL